MKGPLLLELADHVVDPYNSRLKVCESLVQVGSDSCTKVLLISTSGSTCNLEKEELLGLAFEAELVTVDTITGDNTSNSQERETSKKEAQCKKGHQKQAPVQVVTITDREESWKRKLVNSVVEMSTKLPCKTRVSYNIYCINITVFRLG